MRRTLILFAAIAFFYSCSPKITTSISSSYDPLKENEQIAVFGLDNDIPATAEKLGSVRIGDTGFSTNCDYDKVIVLAKQEVRKAGGNALKGYGA
ncbi:MAG: hypothetical protein LBG19_12620 [Prevotellaceae bacterium]|nr:hypothetical protein [Prevotellaceae bacterium]